jgi:autotransporter-associated beta strand protein
VFPDVSREYSFNDLQGATVTQGVITSPGLIVSSIEFTVSGYRIEGNTVTMRGNTRIFDNFGTDQSSGNDLNVGIDEEPAFAGNSILSEHVYDVSAALSLGGRITGTYVGSSLHKTGPGVLYLSHFNDYGGGTTVDAGQVVLEQDLALPVGPCTVAAGATLDLNGHNANVGSVSGAGSVLIADHRQADANGGSASAAVAFGPSGAVLDVVQTNGAAVDSTFNSDLTGFTGSHFITSNALSVSTAFGPSGQVWEVVTRNHSLIELDAAGHETPLAANVNAAAVAFGPSGKVLDFLQDKSEHDGELIQIDATGEHVIDVGINSFAMVFGGPFGEVWDEVDKFHVLYQRSGPFRDLLDMNDNAVALANGPSGLVRDVINVNEQLWQYDSTGEHQLGVGARSVSVAFGPPGELLEYVGGDGSLHRINTTTLTIGSDNSSTVFSGAISGRGNVTKVGAGTFTLAGSVAYAGVTTVHAGALALGGENTFPSGPCVVDQGATLDINDQGSLNQVTSYFITSTSITRTDIDAFGAQHRSSLTYSGPGNLELDTGIFFNVVDVESTAGPATINAGLGTVEIDVTPQGENLDQLGGDLTVNGPGLGLLHVYDQNNPNASTEYHVTASAVTGADPSSTRHRAGILYGGIGSLTLDTGRFSNDVFVDGTVVPTTVNASGGTTNIDVSSETGNLDSIAGELTINGAGSSFLFVVDQGSAKGVNYIVSADTISRTGAQAISYTGIADLFLFGGSASDMFDVLDTNHSLSSATYIYTGVGGNTVYVDKTTGSLDVIGSGLDAVVVGGTGRNTQNINGPVNVTNPTSATSLLVDDSNDPVGRTVTLNDGDVSGLSPADVTWTATPTGTVKGGMANVQLFGGSGNNTFNVNDTDTFYQYAIIAPGTGTSNNNAVNVHATTAPLLVIPDGGTDLVTVGSLAPALGGNLAGIHGYVDIRQYPFSVTSLVVDDQATTTNEGYDITATQVTRSLLNAQGNLVPDMAPIYYSGIANLAVHAGSGGYNLLFVESTAAGTNTDIYGGGNNSQATYTTDAFNVGTPLDGIQGPLALHGRSNTSYVVFNDYNTTIQTSPTYTLTAGGLQRTGLAPITYDGMVEDVLYASEFIPAAVNVQSNADISTYVAAGPGDVVTLGSQAPALGALSPIPRDTSSCRRIESVRYPRL